MQLKTEILDAILAAQFFIAWAGEGLSEPKRLEWWRTDTIDEYGGGDFMLRLAPRTHRWAGLEAAREAARRTDFKARKRMADPDSVRTLFFWGFEVDEQLTERLRDLKMNRQDPEKALSVPMKLGSDFDRDAFQEALKEISDEAEYTVQLSGRELKSSMPQNHQEACRLLLGALRDLPEQYPCPFFRVMSRE